MTPYLQVVSRLLQSFWQINKYIDFVSIFAPITLTEITSDEDRACETEAPIPIQLHLFSFKDTEERRAELELNLKKETGELVNARVQTFFVDTDERDSYFKIHIDPYFSQGFQLADHPKYPSLAVREYRSHGLAIGLNFEMSHSISTYVTLEGLH